MTTPHTADSAPDPRTRAGDLDRDRVVEALRRHHEEGRLTSEEFGERMDTALAARWLDELPPLLADLPSLEHAAPDEEPGDLRRGRRHHAFGPPPWADHERHAWPGGRIPLVPVLLVVAAVATIGALAHGAFPWPLLWVAVALLWLHRSGHHDHRRYAGWPPPWARER
jgi:Domain of unknown function (DUF1707)